MKIKIRILVTVLLALVLCLTFLSWFGGARGVQEIKGWIVLENPFFIPLFFLSLLGIWMYRFPFSYPLAVVGLAGIILVELYYFLFWYTETINPTFHLSTSLSMAYPEFYLSFGLSVAAFVIHLFLKSPTKKTASFM